MHYAFYGPEGSGKGTQAKLLAEKLGLPLYTTGDFVRDAAARDKSSLGDACRKALSDGKYLPDDLVSQLIANKLNSDEAKKGFILDGFPRTLNQARFLAETMEKAGFSLDRLIYLNLSDEESIKRLGKRKRTLFGGSNILHDDPERVKNRLAVYRENEKGVLDFYKTKNILLEVDGVQSIEKIFSDIISGLHINLKHDL